MGRTKQGRKNLLSGYGPRKRFASEGRDQIRARGLHVLRLMPATANVRGDPAAGGEDDGAEGGEARAEAGDPAAGPDDDRFTKHRSSYLGGYASGSYKSICFETLGGAMAAALKRKKGCGGITYCDGLYELRRSTVPKPSPTGETSWVLKPPRSSVKKKTKQG